MATVGRGVYAEAVHEFFEGVRSYDVERAVGVLADDADVNTPWTGAVGGKDAVKTALEGVLGDAANRPSFSLVDVSGDGSVTTLTVSVSGRFGKAPRRHLFRVLHLKGVVHQVAVAPA